MDLMFWYYKSNASTYIEALTLLLAAKLNWRGFKRIIIAMCLVLLSIG